MTKPHCDFCGLIMAEESFDISVSVEKRTATSAGMVTQYPNYCSGCAKTVTIDRLLTWAKRLYHEAKGDEEPSEKKAVSMEDLFSMQRNCYNELMIIRSVLQRLAQIAEDIDG